MRSQKKKRFQNEPCDSAGEPDLLPGFFFHTDDRGFPKKILGEAKEPSFFWEGIAT